MVQNRISHAEYKKILENVPICCVDVIIYCNKKVLLVCRNTEPAKGQWYFPGGRVYKNEKLEGAAVRKAYEEVGLKVQIEKKIGVYETMFDVGPFDNLINGVHTINICFVVALINENPEVKIDETSSDYKWVDGIEEDLHPYIKKVLGDSGVFN